MASTCGFPGMDVLEFSNYDVRCGIHPTPGKILYTSTHDTSTLAGWCTRSFAGGDEPSGIALAGELMGNALASDAPLVMMPLQDVLGLGDDARMNVPGVATGNWTWQAQEPTLLRPNRKLRSSCAAPIDSGAKRDKTPDIGYSYSCLNFCGQSDLPALC